MMVKSLEGLERGRKADQAASVSAGFYSPPCIDYSRPISFTFPDSQRDIQAMLEVLTPFFFFFFHWIMKQNKE